jgi:hypothetical protein
MSKIIGKLCPLVCPHARISELSASVSAGHSRAASRNRTGDLFITSASEHRTPAFRTVHLRWQITVSASLGTALRLRELSRQLSRSLQHLSPSLRSGPPHARERMRRPLGYRIRATETH